MATRPSADRTMWQPQIPIDQSIYETSTTQKAPLGTKLTVGDRIFYYALAGTTITAGDVVGMPPLLASNAALVSAITTGTAGQKVVTMHVGSVMPASYFNDGYICVASGANKGVSYRIKSQDSLNAAGVASSLTLYDDIHTSLTATDKINLIPTVYSNVIHGSESVGIPVGHVGVNVTSASYFWAQTFGPASVNAGVANAQGDPIHVIGTGGSEPMFIAGTDANMADVAMNQVGINLAILGTILYSNPTMLTIRA